MYHNIVLSGGSIFAACFIGCIQYLEENEKVMPHLRNIIGTSAGSVVAFLLTIGFSSQEALQFFITHANQTINSIHPEDIFELIDKMGISDGTNIIRFLSLALQTKYQVDDITFIDLAKKTGRNLVVCVSNLTQEQTEYWSVDTTPQMSVLFALRTSCSIPFIFQPVRYQDSLYADGGLFNNFPIDYFDDKRHPFKDIIGITIDYPSRQEALPDNVLSYFKFLLLKLVKKINHEHSQHKHVDKCANIFCMHVDEENTYDYGFDFESLKFKICENDVKEMVKKSYSTFKNAWIKAHSDQ
jgi:predicted acylesterase/phospholipase RssA